MKATETTPNDLELLVAAESLNPRAVYEWCIDQSLIADNCRDLADVDAGDAARAVAAIRAARARRDGK